MTHTPHPPPRSRALRALRVLLAAGVVTVLASCAAQQEAPATVAESESPAPVVSSVSPTPSPTPVVEIRTVVKAEKIPFQTRRVQDPNLAKGKTRVRTPGVPGVRTLSYEVTYIDRVETSRRLVSKEVTRKPVAKVVAIGTKAVRRCDPNYTGACVPIAYDVDCAGGSGDGPAYVQGPVRVVGSDIYELDRDGDGIACD